MDTVQGFIKACSQTGCSFNTNGLCMENNGDDCQYLTPVIKEEIVTESETTIQDDYDLFQLSSNKEIDEKNISLITNKFPCNLIVLIGEPECGKSTLYAALFDKFNKGGCAGYYFSGTGTSIAFERRCHHARVISQNNTPKTERTYSREFAYLHLSVRKASLDSSSKHLLFADVNGEKYQAARNDDDEMQSLTVLKNADHIFFIADGELLMDITKRQAIKSDIIKLIGRAIQNEMTVKEKGINLLITKWDKVDEQHKGEEVTKFLDEAIEIKFPGLIRKTIHIASRSQNANFVAGSGIEDFFELCLSTPQIENYDYKDIIEDLPKMRTFQKFKYLS
ncbi:TRAFAC clade GTPase domain-containing protein [Pedobacter frigidisoli]|uniref:TRAFAC clade GTPase domain-containing protein n=1 Tax=Pedobacter frigidisoli TaxID=2530455 RepID=UPI00292DAC22|nr:hypothetical protein [Pedobacter frigidisoli]